jgi:hypothetical protein
MSRRLIWITVVVDVLLVVGVGLWWLSDSPIENPVPPPVASSTPVHDEPVVTSRTQTTIGTSVAGRPLVAYTYGTGTTTLLFVGGIHGGYEWNSVFLAYRLMDYLEANPSVIPDNVAVTIIPALNPDGLFAVVGVEGRFAVADVPDAPNTTGKGRFNANNVDLNRNFACTWQATSSWRGNPVSAGSGPFSEPEAAALRDFVLTATPTAAVFWHSAANTVYGSECEEGILPETLTIMNVYATPAQYAQVARFDAYPITGDAEGWLASIGVPAITVELETHDSTDWERNLAGTLAVFEYYRK